MSRSLGKVLITLAALIALALLWQWLAMRDALTLEQLRAWVASVPDWRDAPATVLIVMAVYAVALLVMFPLTLLVGLTGLLFGPAWGFAYATAGTLTSSVVSYWVGRRMGREALIAHGGPRLRLMARYLSRRGIRTMTVINLLPLAPFTLTNMLAGAFHFRFRDYLIGSALGIVPGLAAVTLLGSQLGALVAAESRGELFWALGGLAVALAMLYVWVRRTRRRR